MQRVHHKQDVYLAIATFALMVFGLIIVASASVVQSFEATGSNNYYFIRQLIYAAVGISAWWLFSRIDYRIWRRYATILLGIAGVLLILVLIPGLGVESGGAKRWIDIGGLFTVQASEVLKFALMIYLAYWFEQRANRMNSFYGTFLPFILLLGVVFLLVMQQPDLGSATLVALLAGTMYLVAGANWAQLGIIFGIGVAGIAALIQAAPYRLRRLLTFLNPGADPLGAGYHINQALMAIGSGGLFGLGYGRSRQKYNFLPEAASDSVFAIIGEELGLLGTVALVATYAFIVYRGLTIARQAPDTFGRLLALGATCLIGYQAVLNMGAIVGMIPLTGVPLPFISLGGTSLVVVLAATGILLNISRYTTEPHKDEALLGGWWNWWTRYSNPGGGRGR